MEILEQLSFVWCGGCGDVFQAPVVDLASELVKRGYHVLVTRSGHAGGDLMLCGVCREARGLPSGWHVCRCVLCAE